jgi:hypothetical protein
MCKCVKKREISSDQESDETFEANCKMIEDVISKLNGVSMSHTGIWPDTNVFYF